MNNNEKVNINTKNSLSNRPKLNATKTDYHTRLQAAARQGNNNVTVYACISQACFLQRVASLGVILDAEISMIECMLGVTSTTSTGTYS